MNFISITSQERLNNFIKAQDKSRFLQSWEWGGIQELSDYKVFRIGIEENGELIAAATLIKKSLGLGRSYFYCPGGPIVKNFQFPISNFQTNTKYKIQNSKEILELLFKEIKNIAKKEKDIFLRFEPEHELLITNYKLQITKTIDVQPSKTLILDLLKSEEDLLKEMHPKTRYNVRLAEKKGVEIIEGSADNFENFWKLMSETKERDGFRVHDKDYYFKMLSLNNKKSANNEDPNFQFPISNFQTNSKLYIKLFLAEFNNKIIAGNIMAFFGDTVTYVHGASSNESRNVMAPFCMQWHCIKLARSFGYKYYDFNGIDENKWPGVTRFKKGFGGQEINYPGTFDLVFNGIWYNIYKLIRKTRRMFKI